MDKMKHLKTTTSDTVRFRGLSISLRLVGTGFMAFFGTALILGISGWDRWLAQYQWGRTCISLARWDQGSIATEMMLATVCFVWGAFLWRSANEPLRHGLFIDFTLAAHFGHIGLMSVMAAVIPNQTHHYGGDILIGWISWLQIAIFWFPVRQHSVHVKTHPSSTAFMA
ncbi:MAG: hypothetical protein EOP38_05435 [Rubrivivax sp.]|nr:MAG: hypothetical protein EOP38_05435 [Rubrivivax sp.]